MNSAKVEAISKRAQTLILRQQDYSVEKTAKTAGKSVNFITIWAKRGKTEGFASISFYTLNAQIHSFPKRLKFSDRKERWT